MTQREGSLEAPTRHPLDWRSDEFYDEKALFEELELQPVQFIPDPVRSH
jgi:hypothetical protein